MAKITPQIFCKECASPLVQALDWQQDDEKNWQVRLWCPDCGFEQQAILGPSDTGYLSMAIESGFAYMLEALAELQDGADDDTELELIPRVLTERITPR